MEESGEGATGGSNLSWQPKQDLLDILTGMGISRNAATKALFYTGNYNADLAAAWIFENEDQDLDAPFDAEAAESDDDDDEVEAYIDPGDVCKMVFVINTELNMGVGKIAAQVGHAAIGVHRILLDNQEKYGELLLRWEQFGETKIVLKGLNKDQLIQLATKASTLDLPSYLVQDAGRTQIAAGSTTVLGIMGKSRVVDQVTGELRLL